MKEVHHHKEQLVIENPNDPLSDVTHRLEDIHVTVANETTTATPLMQEWGWFSLSIPRDIPLSFVFLFSIDV